MLHVVSSAPSNADKVKYDWYESSSLVTIDVLSKFIVEERSSVEFGSKTVGSDVMQIVQTQY